MKVYRYSKCFFNHHVVAFFGTSVLKKFVQGYTICLFCVDENSKKNLLIIKKSIKFMGIFQPPPLAN